MKQSEAMKILNALKITIMKLRSNEREALQGFPGSQETKARVLESLQPWIWGNKCILPSLDKIVESGHVEPQVFYNFMFIVDHWIPEVGVLTATRSENDFPTPDIQWMRGWDAE